MFDCELPPSRKPSKSGLSQSPRSTTLSISDITPQHVIYGSCMLMRLAEIIITLHNNYNYHHNVQLRPSSPEQLLEFGYSGDEGRNCTLWW